jgi:hypothetical protein
MEFSFISRVCAGGGRGGRRRKVASSMGLYCADLLATVAKKLASGNRGGEGARVSTAAFSGDPPFSGRSARSSKFGGTGGSVAVAFSEKSRQFVRVPREFGLSSRVKPHVRNREGHFSWSGPLAPIVWGHLKFHASAAIATCFGCGPR